jgi:hypothetical protein
MFHFLPVIITKKVPAKPDTFLRFRDQVSGIRNVVILREVAESTPQRGGRAKRVVIAGSDPQFGFSAVYTKNHQGLPVVFC